ncbi:MAG: alanine--tRNA ligase [Candidatus Cloacimonetes bacterium]|nr:alanine--tRNA ligase [Candidatus Cloacimonadota bacterium]
MLTSSQTRKSFLDFFAAKGHEIVPSAPLVPINDPSLLFTNAGMNQFKDIFLGTGSRDYTRAVDSQKCLRAGGKHNDLEEVGKDEYHHTFFEMLGNWSFGDYYKKEAIEWAWELVTSIWNIPKDRLYASVHYEDDESFELWKKVTDIAPERVLKFGDKDNFWEMADTGPCGPCSEIHYDRGIDHCSHKDDPNHICEVNGSCGRYVEIWNLVFIQFNRLENGELIDLPKKHVDTGAGFERLVAILQGKTSNYETDLFMPIICQIEKIADTKFEDDKHSFRVISDHIRALTCAIADGVLPSNVGRGYVIRRILRRATRFGRIINIHKPFLAELVDTVCDILGDQYPEIIEKKMHVKMAINAEEERFNQTLDMGISKFNDIVDQLGTSTIISGKNAFMLYDTYGFPLDLTELMAEEKGLEVDKRGFEKEMEAQKARARDDAKFDHQKDSFSKLDVPAEHKSEFIGYENDAANCRIEHYYVDEDNNVVLVLDKTPFYAESGGEVADTGKIFNSEFEIVVEDVQKQNDVIFHFGKLVSGAIKEKNVKALVDLERRKNIARNHTATHLLHAALREVLGTHLHQKGSHVAPDRLRFDFTHFQQVSTEELERVERLVNQKIISNIPVNPSIEDLDNARKKGAMALFGEKYEKKVRVIGIGDYSMELCGGLHSQRTGDVGFFKIISESSIAAGVRRIEAVTGLFAYDFVKEHEHILHQIQGQLNTKLSEVPEKIDKLHAENKELRKHIDGLESSTLRDVISERIAQKIEVEGVAVVSGILNVNDVHQLKEAADILRQKIGSCIGLFGAAIDDKVSLVCIVTKDLTKRFHAGKIVNKAAAYVGGKGGGKPDMAMAGGKNLEGMKNLFEEIHKIIKSPFSRKYFTENTKKSETNSNNKNV